MRLTLDHCTDGALISDELSKEGYAAFVGPSFGGKTKPELANKSFETAKCLNEAGVSVSIITYTGNIVSQSVKPNVNYVFCIKIYGDTPLKRAS